MIAIHNQTSKKDDSTLNPSKGLNLQSSPEHETAIRKVAAIPSSMALLLPKRIVTHNSDSGLNPLVDAASYLFSVLGKLKHAKSYRQLAKLQTELVQEINLFQETIKHHGYNAEHIIVYRYILCATIDDIITNTSWGSQGQWESYSLLTAFNQDTQHQDKFFNIMERAIKDPGLYIDLMELMYICLSMGYKGQYRVTEHSQYQLDQITNNLYKHIRAFRGNISKTLSSIPLKLPKPTTKSALQNSSSPLFIFFVTACVVMTIFVSLGYLMDVISNEAYKNISQIQSTVSHKNSE